MDKSIKTDNKNKHLYNVWDIFSIIFNIFLSIIYIPVSTTSLIMLLFVWDIHSQTAFDLFKGIIATILVLMIPASCILGISLSILLRIRGKKKESLWVQFIPIPIFLICVTLIGLITHIQIPL